VVAVVPPDVVDACQPAGAPEIAFTSRNPSRPFAPQLAADAAGLHPAERGGGVHAVGLVDAERPVRIRRATSRPREASAVQTEPDSP
jgi:hypothetical protein